MHRDFFGTLFARMLAVYLGIVLALIALTGCSVAALLHAQTVRLKKEQLSREVAAVALLYTGDYQQPESRVDSEAEMRVIARQNNALIQIYSADGTTLQFSGDVRWAPLSAIIFSGQQRQRILSGSSDTNGVRTDFFGTRTDFPIYSASKSVKNGDNVIAAIYLHADVSDIATTTRSMYFEVILVALIAVILAVLAVYYMTARTVQPFLEINSIVQRYSKGDFAARIPVSHVNEAAQLAESFNAMADQLKDLEATRRSFVNNISHELRSPLTSMRGFLEAMQDGTIGTEDHDKYIDIVLSETRRMTVMVNDLLDLARIESGKIPLKLEVFDVNELIRRTLITFEARIYEKHMDVEVKFAQDQYYVEADNAQISQVLRNLTDNALKYSPDRRKLRIATYSMQRKVYVSVQDSGQGIPEEDVPHVFDRFYKVEKAHTPTKQSGTGLGLSIVKRIIDQHGQTITLKSSKGKGSTFTFTLKRAPSPKRQQDGGKRNG